MKRSLFSLMAAVALMSALLATSPRLHSQEAAVKKSPEEQLIALKTANAALLEKQQKTLQKLEDLKLQADQLRIMSKRA